MVEFNPDGSIKLPERIQKAKADKENRMKIGRCIKVTKEIISTYAPKKCALKILLSDKIVDNAFMDNVFRQFNNSAETPMRLEKINEKEFIVHIDTSFRRCSECSKLIGNFRQFLYGNLIEEKGTCTYEPPELSRGFSYEDYFE